MSPSAARSLKELESLPRQIGLRVLTAVEGLAAEPRPSGCRKIQGATGLWRIRVGDYRVVYEVADTELVVWIVSARHRREAYR